MSQDISIARPSDRRPNHGLTREAMNCDHPVAIAFDLYSGIFAAGNKVPTIAMMLKTRNSLLSDFIMFLEPEMNYGRPDCKIILRGERIPGNFNPDSHSGRSYREFLVSETNENAPDHLQQVFGALVTRQVLIQKFRSPFKSNLNITTYRGIFPVWNTASKCIWAALVCAPKYAEIPSTKSGNVTRLEKPPAATVSPPPPEILHQSPGHADRAPARLSATR